MTNPAAVATPATTRDSEFGLLPRDWDVLRVRDLRPFVTSGSRGWARYYSDMGSPFLRITNLSRESIYPDLDELRLVALPAGQSEAERTQLEAGDVLVSITADIGIIGYVDERVPLPAYINQHIALIRFDPKRTDGRFVAYFLASDRPQRVFRNLTDQGAKAGMSLITVRKLAVAHPGVEEQREIAAALADVDALIGALDKLIEKKRAIKLATMQQLLTGRRRLPDFSTRWKSYRLRELVLDFIVPMRDKPTNLRGSVPWCRIEDFDGKYLCASKSGQGVDAATIAKMNLKVYPVETLLVSCSADLGRCAIVKQPLVSNQTFIGMVFDDSKAVSEFFYYYMSFNAQVLNDLSSGTTISYLSREQFESFKVVVPATAVEQLAIAKVLSDMDAEIAAMEQRRDKTKLIKQGMMQVLLTGKVRLL
jgi:type I restriction enzyme S subunit